MPAPIGPIQDIPIDPVAIRPADSPSRPGAFQEALETAIDRVESFRRLADGAVGRFVAGESEELHSTVLAAQRAELSFELFVQVRNKVVQAYQEIMRMQM